MPGFKVRISTTEAQKAVEGLHQDLNRLGLQAKLTEKELKNLEERTVKKLGATEGAAAVDRLTKSVGLSKVEAEKLKNAFNVDSSSLKDADKSIAGMDKNIASLVGGLITATVAFTTLKSLMSQGLKYLEQIETSTLGIASSFLSGGKYFDQTTNKALSASRALTAAQQDSAQIIEELKVANLQTIATLDELIIAYQTALPVALSRGFDRKMVKDFTVAMVQAAGAIGLPMNQMAEEIRSMLMGTISPRNTRIATVLGLRSEDIAKYKGDAQGLFDFLMTKLEAYRIAGVAAQNTWAGLWSNTKDIISQVLGQVVEPLFEQIKVEMQELAKSIYTIDEKTKTIKWNAEFVEGIKTVKNVITSIIAEMYRLGMFADRVGGSLNRLSTGGFLGGEKAWQRNDEWRMRYMASEKAIQDMAMREQGFRPVTADVDAQMREQAILRDAAIKKALAAGKSMQQALKENPKQFEQMSINIGNAAEHTNQLLRYYKQLNETKPKWEPNKLVDEDEEKRLLAQRKNDLEVAQALNRNYFSDWEGRIKQQEVISKASYEKDKNNLERSLAEKELLNQAYYLNQAKAIEESEGADKNSRLFSARVDWEHKKFALSQERFNSELDLINKERESTYDMYVEKGAMLLIYDKKQRDLIDLETKARSAEDRKLLSDEQFKNAKLLILKSELEIKRKDLARDRSNAELALGRKEDEVITKKSESDKKRIEEIRKNYQELSDLTKTFDMSEIDKQVNELEQKRKSMFNLAAGSFDLETEAGIDAFMKVWDRINKFVDNESDKLKAKYKSTLKEMEISSKLFSLDIAEAGGTPARENVGQRIELTKELLSIQESVLISIDKGKDTTSWLEQQKAIDQTRMALVQLKREQLMLDPVAAMKLGFKEAYNEFTDTGKQMYELSKTIASDMSTAFSDFFFDVFDGKMKSLGDYVTGFARNIVKEIANIMGRKVAASIIGEGFGGGLSSLLGFGLSLFGGGIGGGGSTPYTGVDTGGAYSNFAHKGGMTGEYERKIIDFPRRHQGIGPNEEAVIKTKDEGIFTKGQMNAMAPVFQISKMIDEKMGKQGSPSLTINVPITISRGQITTAHIVGLQKAIEDTTRKQVEGWM